MHTAETRQSALLRKTWWDSVTASQVITLWHGLMAYM